MEFGALVTSVCLSSALPVTGEVVGVQGSVWFGARSFSDQIEDVDFLSWTEAAFSRPAIPPGQALGFYLIRPQSGGEVCGNAGKECL